ncbi:MAG TPA: family 20 glycosylhydrolase [Flavisolibacter sp.]|nr:family 20 glycosylhydrolase [Flavisolibacter sp.]
MKNARNSFHQFYIFLFFLAGFVSVKAQQTPALIPQPTSITTGKASFTVTPNTTIHVANGSPFGNEAALLAELFQNSFGQPLSQTTKASPNQISLKHDKTITAAEGYRISITAKETVVAAGSPVGMFRAVQTIRQLLPPSVEGKAQGAKLVLPAVEIDDAPSFGWRGIHLDVSRHFFSLDYVKKLIDLMALYKLNKFHFHLTDDQGWRVEIKKYPKLTEEGAWRSFNNQDSVCMERAKENPDFIIDPKHIVSKDGKQLYGGFYTQVQLKELVAYAVARHIEIIPEIDMPGHMMAAINSYNYLSCDSTSRFGQFFSTPICPCNPSTIQFAKDIFTEIMDIFPSKYIHIGGDEVDRTYWEKSDACKALMQKEGMKNSAELQAWFIRQMESFFNANGKKLIGWDEILEGGVTKTATIMYWRTWVPHAPVEAAKSGNNVIMTPGNPMYFSDQPDKNSLPAVYNYEMIPKELTPTEAKRIVGGQGNLWTEYIPTEQRADYLYMPRLTALAENLWSGKKNYSSYLQRLNTHYERLDYLDVSYRLPDLELLNEYAFTEATVLSVKKPFDELIIRYTLDGSAPTSASAELKGPLPIRQSAQVRLAAFTKGGRRGDVQDVHFKKQSWAKAHNLVAPKKGLEAIWYKRSFDSTSLISGSPDGKFTVSTVSVPAEAKAETFALQFRGYIDVPQQGIYTFYLTSDDASFLRIAGREVVNNDGMHPPRERNGQVALQKGSHPFALDFIEGGGGFTLRLKYSLNGSEPKDIPAGWLKH